MFYVSSLDRPRQVAKTLKSMMHDLRLPHTLTDCKDAVARMYGHFDFKALEASIGAHPASPDDVDSDRATVALRLDMQLRVLVDLGIDEDDAAEIVADLNATGRDDVDDELPFLEVPLDERVDAMERAQFIIDSVMPLDRSALRLHTNGAVELAEGGKLEWLFHGDCDVRPELFMALEEHQEDGFSVFDFVATIIAVVSNLIRTTDVSPGAEGDELRDGITRVASIMVAMAEIPLDVMERGSSDDCAEMAETVVYSGLANVVVTRLLNNNPKEALSDLLQFAKSADGRGETLNDVVARFCEAASSEMLTRPSSAEGEAVDATLDEVFKAVADGYYAVPILPGEIDHAASCAVWRSLELGLCADPMLIAFMPSRIKLRAPDGTDALAWDMLMSAYLQGATIEDFIEVATVVRKFESERHISTPHRDLRGGAMPYLVAAAYGIWFVSPTFAFFDEMVEALRRCQRAGLNLADVTVLSFCHLCASMARDANSDEDAVEDSEAVLD